MIHAPSNILDALPLPLPLVVGASPEQLPLLTTIAAGFAAAWLLGLLTQRLGLSPIVGYLLGGIVIGPHTPGFIGDVALAQQLAEIGVILLMFGVGMHFHLRDLWRVRSVAIPGAIGQSLVATLAAMGIFYLLGMDLKAGMLLGMAMSVASTVVLLRVLMDRGMVNTTHGHVAIGWLIVEDILTILLLVMVPLLADRREAIAVATEAGATPEGGFWSGALVVGIALAKLAAMIAIVLIVGSRVVPWVLTRVAKLRSPELFTLTVLVLSVTIAVGSAVLFGASVALGAFLAGIVVAQSPVSHQAAADALPMRDAFAVLFFVSVGMLFDPSFLVTHPHLVAVGLGVVLILKPIAALALVAICGYPVRTALTVAIGLSQIGEFSFILAHLARDHGLLSDEGMHLLVATAIISIALNPLLFRSIDSIERRVEGIGWLHRLLDARHARQRAALNKPSLEAIAAEGALDSTTETGAPRAKPLAIIVGYGPVGRLVHAMLRDAGMEVVVIDLNIDTIRSLAATGHHAIYGDANRREVLEHAGIRRAAALVVTLPHSEGRADLVLTARELNATVDITIRARYLTESDVLKKAGANTVIVEEGETGVAIARAVLEKRGVDAPVIERLLAAIRRLWHLQDASSRS
jgi:monovalent cation:H+ antiporter-2, CPA2 family